MKKHMKQYLAMLLSFAMVCTMGSALPVRGAEAGKEAAPKAGEGLLASYVFEDSDATDKSIADVTGNGFDATLSGTGASVSNGMLSLPGGGAGSSAAYVTLPGSLFEDRDTLTVTTWLKNQTGSGNYAGMYFGTPSQHIGGGSGNMPLHYWLLNPANPDGYFKSVWTDGDNAGAPYSTETPVSATKTSSDWGMYTTVITPNRIVGYYNGVEVCSNSKSKTTADFGTGLVAYIGRSPYNDMFYKGGVFGTKVYGSALSQKQIWEEYYSNMPAEVDKDAKIQAGLNAAKAALDLGDLSAVTGDITLPLEASNGASVSWESSNPAVISEKGEVHRDTSQDVTVTLTATLSLGGKSDTKPFTATVRKASDENLFQEFASQLRVDTVITESFALPDTDSENITVDWSSSSPSVLAISEEGGKAKAVVTRPDKEDARVRLSVKAAFGEGDSRQEISKEFDVVVRAKDYGYLLAYTNQKETSSLGNSLHLAYSQDGNSYTALNSNTGICFARNVGGNKNTNPNGLRDVTIFRKADGTYGMVARNVGKESYIYVFESEDLTEFTNERTLTLGHTVAGGLQVRAASYGGSDIRYEIYWTDGNASYRAVTRDFASILEQGQASYTVEGKSVEGTVPAGAEIGSVLSLGQKEYQRVVNKLGVVTNTGIRPVELEVQQGASAADLFAGRKVTATYSDGSTKEMAVDWDAQDIAKIDTKTPGTYTVSGTVSQTKYANPFIEQRADPCILQGNDGYYYFTASYPVCGNSEEQRGIGYDRVILRRSETIEGLADAQEVAIWECKNSPNQFRYIWAPEIRLVDGNYYVFYTASINSGSVWGIRPHVLKCTDPTDIMNPASWQEMGRMKAVSGDTTAFSDFSLDMTVFENNGRWYVVWAQTVGASSLLIAEINPENPVECISESVLITKPEYAWERQVENVNEGPSIIKNNGKIYMAFSAAGTGPEYCVGLLSIDEDEDMLDAAAWKKQAYPVLTSSDVPGEYGPGHNSFTVDEEGNPIFVYHARTEECYNNQCAWASSGSLYDPCRQARLKRVHWSADGTPILKMSYEEELAEANQKVTATVKVAKAVQEVAGVIMSQTGMTLTVGQSKALSARVVPEDAADKTITWKSSAPDVASVVDGRVTAKKAGTATITAMSKNGKSASCKVTVKAKDVAVKSVKLNVKRATLGVKEKLTLKATVTPKNATNKKVSWKLDKKGIVSISSKGVVTAKKKGSVTVTATAGGKKATCKLTVKKAPSKITLNAGKKTLKKGKTYKLKVKLPKNTASYKITYSSSKKKVASVSSSGKIKALKKGTATITAKTFNGKKAKIKITVR